MSPENERAGAREHLLAQGKELAANVTAQYERWCRAPFNNEEAARLRMLQQAFLTWERQANAQCPCLDTKKEFPDSRLRPFEREVTVSDIARLRKTPSPVEAHFQSVRLASAHQKKKSTGSEGFWSGMPGGI